MQFPPMPKNEELEKLLEKDRSYVPTPEEREEAKRSFVAGNMALHTGEELDVVRARVDKVADEMRNTLPKEQ
jgi:hypothetical protein